MRDRAEGDADAPSRTAIFHSVFNQVCQHLGDLVGIHGKEGRLCRAARYQIRPVRRCHIAQVVADPPHQGCDVGALRRAHPLIRLDPTERQQIPDEAVHPPRFACHHTEKPVPRCGIIACGPLQGLDIAQQGGQRAAQFMADIGDKIAAQQADLLPLGNVLESAEHAVLPVCPERGDCHPVDGLKRRTENHMPPGAAAPVSQTGLDMVAQRRLTKGRGVKPPDNPLTQKPLRWRICGRYPFIPANQYHRHRNGLQNCQRQSAFHMTSLNPCFQITV